MIAVESFCDPAIGGCLVVGDKYHLSYKNLETIYGDSHRSMFYLNCQDSRSDSLNRQYQDGERSSEYLNLLTALFIVMPTRYF